MLLQVIVALMPVFAIQLWYDCSKDHKKMTVYIGLFSFFSMSVSIILGSGVSLFDYDFCLVPLLLGAFYGGVRMTWILTAAYMVLQILSWDGIWTWVELSALLLIVLPLLLLTRRTFEKAKKGWRLRLAMGLMGIMAVIQMTAFIVFRQVIALETTAQDYMLLFIHVGLSTATAGAAVYLFEIVREKQRLQDEVERISNNYRIEVQKLQQFIEKIPLGVVFTDRRGMVTHINEMAAQTMLENQGETLSPVVPQMIGQPFSALDFGSTNHSLSKQLVSALNGHSVSSEIIQEQDKMYIQSGICIRDMEKNEIVGAAVISHDVTELNRLRAELGRMERLSLVGQMAASITHEIRNPMAVIRGFVQLMQERSPGNQQDYYRIVIDELDRANSIINDFLSLAQNRVIEKENCSLHHILHDILPLLWADANMRGLSVELDLAEEIPLLMLNVKEMKQLVLNLARNGMEAIEHNGVLTLRTIVTEDGVELRVIDDGCGISKDKQERLFEPFYTTKTRGTGLGLPLCLSIVERHDGHIRVESEEGEGTTFIVTFKQQVSA